MDRTGAQTATAAAGHNRQFLLRRAEQTELPTHLKNGLAQLVCLSAKLHLVITWFLLIVFPLFFFHPTAVSLSLLTDYP